MAGSLAPPGGLEPFDITVLPGDLYAPRWATRVQPDALIASSTDYVFIEAKGTRRGASFQPEQLHREMLVADANREGRKAALLVVTAEPSPVLVAGCGRMSLNETVAHGHKSLRARQPDAPLPGRCRSPSSM